MTVRIRRREFIASAPAPAGQRSRRRSHGGRNVAIEYCFGPIGGSGRYSAVMGHDNG
jgi:hypothetical protein